MKILIVCSGNTCRSQMAEGFLKSFDPKLEVYSAGTNIKSNVNPIAIKAMSEVGIDITHHYPKHVDEFLNTDFDYVITLCNNANDACPFFAGKVKTRLHFGFANPTEAEGSEEEVLPVYRKVRDQIKTRLYVFYKEQIGIKN
jgi:arsenate reductase (thioredoxin)